MNSLVGATTKLTKKVENKNKKGKDCVGKFRLFFCSTYLYISLRISTSYI